MPDVVRRVVIGYDGSEEACRAVDFAARAFCTDCAVVVNAWHDPGAELTLAPMGAPPPLPSEQREVELERNARTVAEEGAVRARGAGLEAEAVTCRSAGAANVARVLHDVAEARGAALIVVGHRHASLIESALLGSVAVSAVRDDRHPVLVVPA